MPDGHRLPGIKSFVSTLLLWPVAAASAVSWRPAQADLETALKSAEGIWEHSIDEKIHIDMEPLNPCRANADQSAVVNIQSTTITTTVPAPDPPVVSTIH